MSSNQEVQQVQARAVKVKMNQIDGISVFNSKFSADAQSRTRRDFLLPEPSRLLDCDGLHARLVLAHRIIKVLIRRFVGRIRASF